MKVAKFRGVLLRRACKGLRGLKLRISKQLNIISLSCFRLNKSFCWVICYKQFAVLFHSSQLSSRPNFSFNLSVPFPQICNCFPVWLKAAFLGLFICTPGIAQISSVHGVAQNLNAFFFKGAENRCKQHPESFRGYHFLNSTFRRWQN